MQLSGLKTAPCPFHFLVHLDKNEEFQVNSSCESLQNIIHKKSFVLPPLMEYYYKKKHSFYKISPPFRTDCTNKASKLMDFISPKNNEVYSIKKDFNGNESALVFKLIHSNKDGKVFWYLNKTFIGLTSEIHEKEIAPKIGVHKITVIDEFGNEIIRNFEIKR